MHRRQRMNLALALLAIGLVANVVILARGEESPGWPLAAIILLFGAALTLLSERRPP